MSDAQFDLGLDALPEKATARPKGADPESRQPNDLLLVALEGVTRDRPLSEKRLVGSSRSEGREILRRRAQQASVILPEVRLMSSGRSEGGHPDLLEGIVDLAFREDDGWVIADYKTDLGTDPDFAARSAAYRSQVELYAECWSALTGDHVKERVLVYTTQQRTESW